MVDRDDAGDGTLLPREPIHRLTKPLNAFLHVQSASGVFLLLCAGAALVLANSAVAEDFQALWQTPVGFSFGEWHLVHPLKHWINDGLMAVFFFVIGLEVKREIALGELRDLRRAALPIAAALGGMLVPAGFYLALQWGRPGSAGWGIPMATDIAFVVGCMAVLGRRVPSGLRVVLLSLAIVDDIGAILVIAIGYTEGLHVPWLIGGGVGILVVLLMQSLGVRSMTAYFVVGVATWLAFHESGIHATIAGVVLGMLTPARPYLEQTVGGDLLRRASDLVHGDWEHEGHRAEKVRTMRRVSRETISPVEYLIHVLHPWVALLVMPLFALANAGVRFEVADLASPVAVAVIVGLAAGKPIGILSFSWLSVRIGAARLPEGVGWRHMLGGACLAGVGFTMALFIAELAFDEAVLLRTAKVGVLVGSLVSALAGIVLLARTPVPPDSEETPAESQSTEPAA